MKLITSNKFKITNKQSKHLIMPFCKFCKDSGKTQTEFTSHYPKDKPGKEGKVVCPTILNNECRYCHTKGHAKSHCPVLKEKNSRKRMTSVPQRFNRRRPQKTPNNLNGWAMTAMKQHRQKPKGLRVQAVKYAASQNAFAALNEEDEKSKRRVDLPKAVKPTAPAGSWGKKPDLSKEAIQQRIISKKQELAVEEQLKEEQAGMTQLLTVKDAIAQLNLPVEEKTVDWGAKMPDKKRWDLENSRSGVVFSTLNWGDIAMEEDEEEEEEFFDSLGRPSTDNSAW